MKIRAILRGLAEITGGGTRIPPVYTIRQLLKDGSNAKRAFQISRGVDHIHDLAFLLLSSTRGPGCVELRADSVPENTGAGRHGGKGGYL